MLEMKQVHPAGRGSDGMARRQWRARLIRAWLWALGRYAMWAVAGAVLVLAIAFWHRFSEIGEVVPGSAHRQQLVAAVLAEQYPPATCQPPSEAHAGNAQGFGHQYYLFVTGYMMARIMNRTFCVTPWRRVAHEQDPASLYKFASGDAFGPRAPHGHEPMNIYLHFYRHVCRLAACSETPDGRPQEEEFWLDLHYTRKEDWDYIAAGLYEEFAEDVRQKYLSGPKPALEWFGDPEVSTLGVHVRRGDVEAGRRVPDVAIIQCVQSALASMQAQSYLARYLRPRKWEVHIFSDAGFEQLGVITEAIPDARLHLRQPLEATFHHMVHADALIVARSSFSAMAAYLSHGTIFAPFDPKRVSFYGHQMLIRRPKLHRC
jgi:hypothetical protein